MLYFFQDRYIFLTFCVIIGIVLLILMVWFIYEIYKFFKHWCCYKYNSEKGQKDEEKFIELDSKFYKLSRTPSTSTDEEEKNKYSSWQEPISLTSESNWIWIFFIQIGYKLWRKKILKFLIQLKIIIILTYLAEIHSANNYTSNQVLKCTALWGKHIWRKTGI